MLLKAALPPVTHPRKLVIGTHVAADCSQDSHGHASGHAGEQHLIRGRGDTASPSASRSKPCMLSVLQQIGHPSAMNTTQAPDPVAVLPACVLSLMHRNL